MSRTVQRLSPEREQRVLENLQAWGERGSPQIRAIAVRKTAELLPRVDVQFTFISPEQFLGLFFGGEKVTTEEAVVN